MVGLPTVYPVACFRDRQCTRAAFPATPPDCTGVPITRVRLPIVNPAPFNHDTKIAVLRVLRKG